MGARGKAAALGVFFAALVFALAACSAFNPNVGPYRDAGAAGCTASEGTGYGGYGTTTSEDAGAGCGDAS
jgi:hypothetical protein